MNSPCCVVYGDWFLIICSMVPLEEKSEGHTRISLNPTLMVCFFSFWTSFFCSGFIIIFLQGELNQTEQKNERRSRFCITSWFTFFNASISYLHANNSHFHHQNLCMKCLPLKIIDQIIIKLDRLSVMGASFFFLQITMLNYSFVAVCAIYIISFHLLVS
jgi:hypothetical protein